MTEINQIIFMAMFALATWVVCYVGYKGRAENLPAVLILPISTSAMMLMLVDLGDDLLFIVGLALLGMFLLMMMVFAFLMYLLLQQVKAGLNEKTD